MVNYFELYGLPVSFHPPKDAVQKKFYELSRQFHPDRFAQGGAEAMEEALRMSALNNEAYKTLKDEDAVVKYVLKLHGLLEDEEKYNLPPNFLMDMMELNEAVSEYEMEPDEEKKEIAVSSWRSQEEDLEKELQPLLQSYDEGNRETTLLEEVKDYYFRKKYLLRVRERIAKFAPL